MNKKKKIIIILVSILTFILILFSIIMFLLSRVSNESEKVEFNITSGTSTVKIIKDLKDNNLIRSELLSKIYIKLSGKTSLKAGVYMLNRNMSTIDIIDTLNDGKTLDNTVSITFKPGYKVSNYAKDIKDKLGIDESVFLSTINDLEYLNTLISKYWFLTDEIISDKIYYALEGYLYPDTYSFYKTASSKDIIEKMLDNTEKKLNKYKDSINNSNYSVHEILTIASIIANESKFSEDRSVVSQVIYKRLSLNMSLGMDVTTYYGVRKDLTEDLTQSDLNSVNGYNTRNTSLLGLPVGPICNMSTESIEASLNPSNTDYVYFYADVKTGKLYFANTYSEFLKLKEIYG
jgi:UPF0755 protein